MQPSFMLKTYKSKVFKFVVLQQVMEKILIVDFGSQYTQLIARRIRELNIFCEIFPFNNLPSITDDVKGIILSGSPGSVHDKNYFNVDLKALFNKKPVLGVCYGAQLIAQEMGGKVEKSNKREYGRSMLKTLVNEDIFVSVSSPFQAWMSHSDTITQLPDNFELIGNTESVKNAAFRSKPGDYKYPIFGIQFHPEVTHTKEGVAVLKNFCVNICNCQQSWTAALFVDTKIAELKEQLGEDRVIMALSGGVDSTVAATLINNAIGERLYCIFVNNALLRKDEFAAVLHSYKKMGLNVKGIDASALFFKELNGVEDPEKKRKIIGKLFIDVFQSEAEQIKNVKWLGQGTIYPDVIESISVHGPSQTIKSHHNVGGLPEKMHMKVVEPLRMLFKDEVRRVGKELNIAPLILSRHPFPGPGLAIRIIGPVTEERVKLLQEADAIFINALKKENLYDKVWQAGVILLNTRSVGVMGDERTYENVAALRAVESTDGMTADWSHLPYEFLANVSNDIINNVKGINRVVYDISSKPPATIEWE